MADSWILMQLAPWLIMLLFGLSFGGLTYVVMQGFMSGADAYSGAYSEHTARQFEDVFLFIPPRRISEIGWVSAAVGFATMFMLTVDWSSFRGIVLALLLGTLFASAGLYTPHLLLKFLKQRRLNKFNLQLVDTLVSMSNALKAGFSIIQAFESVVRDGENPIAQEFDVFLQQTRVGVSFQQALRNLEDRVGSEDLTLVVLAIESARITGGNLTEIFEKISATIRERMRIEGRIKTLTAQGRLQGIIVGAMPVAIGFAMMLVDPEMMVPFLHSMLGLGIIIAVGVLILCGALVIRKIINIDV